MSTLPVTPDVDYRVDPKGMREILFAGLLMGLEAALEDAWPDYDHTEALKNPDGTTRQGSPYWQAWHHAAGIRSVLHYVRSSLQTHEEYLVTDRERSRLTWSETEMACAQHHDVCPHCAVDGQASWRVKREQARNERLRAIYSGGIGQVVLAIATARENGREITVEAIGLELQRVQAAAKRERTN